MSPSYYEPEPQKKKNFQIRCPNCINIISIPSLLDLFKIFCSSCGQSVILSLANKKVEGSFAVAMGQLLLSKGLILREHLEYALETKKDSAAHRFVDFLIAVKYISEEELISLARRMVPQGLYHKTPPEDNTIDLDKIKIEKDIVNLIPASVAKVLKVVPYDFKKGVIYVAMSYPFDEAKILNLKEITGYPVSCSSALKEAIERALTKYYSNDWTTSVEDFLSNVGIKESSPPEKVCTTREELTKWTARKLGYQYVNLDETEISEKALRLVPRNVAIEYNIIPVSYDNDLLTIAVTLPTDFLLFESLALVLKRKIKFVVSSEPALKLALKKYYSL